MAPELKLPTLPEDKTSPDYVSHLDEGFQRLQDILMQESNTSQEVLLETLKELSVEGDVETTDLGSFGEKGKDIYIGHAEVISVKIDPSKVGDIKKIIEQTLSERRSK